MGTERPLDGCTVVVTRDEPGELGRLLAAAGAAVVHVPLIQIVEPRDGGAVRSDALQRLEYIDWVIVTSTAGADRVGSALARYPNVRLAAVGTATAARLEESAGRAVDLVPDRQLAESLAETFVDLHLGRPQRVLLALADRAAPTLHDILLDAGHDATVLTAYRTELRRPSDAEIARLRAADAVLFTSGSAVESWSTALGSDAAALLPDITIAIGPTTAQKFSLFGLKISSVAADHSLAGLVTELTACWHGRATP